MSNAAVINSRFEVLEPYRLRELTLRNRILFSSTVCMIGNDHDFSDERIAYYAERAAGGVGAVITEGLSVHPTSIPTSTVPIVHDERNIDNFSHLADAVHQEGAAIFGQLWHVGRQSLWSPFLTPWSASGQRDPLSGSTPHAMTEAEIKILIDYYARSARNLERAGFDGAEIHSAHGYLPQQFLSPWSNWRTDRWGGSLENRARFLVGIIDAIRANVSSKFIVGLKLAAHEYVEGGIDLQESKRIAAHLRKTAPVDFIEVSVANFSPSLERHVPDMRFPDKPFCELSAGIREASDNTPVMAVAKIPSVETAESMLAAAAADLFGMARPLLADPHLVRKKLAGQTPRPCVYCNICWDMTHQLRPITCFYAPPTGEADIGASQDHDRQVVRIIGAGPAGLEAARIAAINGHETHIYDKESECGGRLRRDSSVPGRERLEDAWQWMKSEAVKAGALLHFGMEIGETEILEWPRSDIIVQATGAVPDMNVIDGEHIALSLEDAIEASDRVQGAVTVIDEIEEEPVYALCEMLAARGHPVRLVTRRPLVGRRNPHVNMIGASRRMDLAGIDIHADLVPARIEDGRLIARHGLSGRERKLGPVDTVIYAGPYKTSPMLTAAGHNIHVIGDAYSPRALVAVVAQAREVARLIGARDQETPSL